MITISIKVYDKIIWFLNSLAKKDVEVLYQQKIEEIDPTKLSENDFDYISEEKIKRNRFNDK